MEEVRRQGINSIMVEGGPTLLKSFIKEGLYDEIRIESAPVTLGKGLPAPALPDGLKSVSRELCRENVITVFRR